MNFQIDTRNQQPIYQQVRDQVVFGIASKELAPGENLPSVRGLAAELGINFHTVNKGYTMLCDEGYIEMDRRKGAVIVDEMAAGEDYKKNLAEQLKILSAEAICRGVNINEFLNHCITEYKNVSGGKDKTGL